MIGSELIQFRDGQTSQVVGDRAANGRGQGKAVPGAEGQRQPWKPREAADKREVIPGEISTWIFPLPVNVTGSPDHPVYREIRRAIA
ncbi:MAG TPA: hypothetical protein VF458_06930 [Ktedonobacteraceae bacterium]